VKAATLEFLRQRFSDYYRKNPLPPPPSVSEREFGFIYFDLSTDVRMRRHIGFPDAESLGGYVRSMVPAHCYYSSAYYANPGAPTMDEKGWTGADLIFDLDADHIMRGPYEQMLDRVREEAIKLLAMLTDELGFNRRMIEVVFSGGRGYHFHIRDLLVRGWGSQERREVIDYVCGIGLEPGIVLAHRSSSHRGWRGRYIASVTEYLAWLASGAGGDEGAMGGVRHLEGLPGIGEETAQKFVARAGELSELLAKGEGARLASDRTLSRVLGVLNEGADPEFTSRLRAKAALADEPVTTDTKRLIRLPSSLHGGSGFRTVKVPLSELPEFDPLLSAVVFGDRTVKVDLSRALTLSLSGNRYALSAGVAPVPEVLAVFLCCRGLAEIATGG
jgi:DNA primase small subunit